MTVEARGIQNVRREIALLKDFVRKGDKWMMTKVGKYALALMLKRTRAGVDKDGKPFIPKRSGGTSNLTRSGKLLNDVRVQSSAKVSRIYVGTQVRGKITNFNLMIVHARGLKAGRGTGFKMPVRDPMGFPNAEIDKIREFFRRLIKGKLKRQS